MRYAILLLILSILGWTNATAATGFIQNKGQWEGDFLYRKEVKLGAIFLESDGIMFHLRDWSPVARAHTHNHTHSDEQDSKDHDHADYDELVIRHHAFKLNFIGANLDANIIEEGYSKNYYNYFLGNDPKKWHSNIYAVKTIIYEALYDGIDLHVIDNGDGIKYEFHVQPFADPNQIAIEAVGLEGIKLDDEGQLALLNSISDMIEMRPVLFQTIRKKKMEFKADFRVNGNRITYDLPSYDSTSTLIIDPVLVFSTYSGSTADNWGYSATPDLQGFLISGGIVSSTGYPITTGAWDANYNGGGWDIGLTKYDTTGTTLIFSTYLGGSSTEAPHSLIVDGDNNILVYGATGSTNFPTSNNAHDQIFNGGAGVSFNGLNYSGGTDIFVTKFNSSGTSIIGSTFVGGSNNDGINISNDLTYNYADQSRGEINIDDDNNIYVASSTFSFDFPVSTNAFRGLNQGNQDAVVFRLSPTLSNLDFSTYLGGGGNDAGYAIDIASDKTVYVAGGTSSGNFPVHFTGMQNNFRGDVDGYIVRLDAGFENVIRGTFIGTNRYDQVYLMQLDDDDRPHYFGQSESTGAQLIESATYNEIGGGQIVGRLNSNMNDADWMTRFGNGAGSPNISPTAILVDICNNVYMAGWGGALNTSGGVITGLETTNDALKNNADAGGDFYFAVLPNDASELIYGSYYGGNQSGEHVDGGTSRFDPSGKIYQSVCAGCGGVDDFPIEPDPGAWSPTNGSNNCNNGVFKLDFDLPLVIADIDLIPEIGCAPYTIAFENTSDVFLNSSYQWSFGNGDSSVQTNPIYTFTESGEFEIQLIVNDPTTCNLTDTATTSIVIKTDTLYSIPNIVACAGQPVTIGPNPDSFSISGRTPAWVPSNLVSDPGILNPTVTLNQGRSFRMLIDYGGCVERIDQFVEIDTFPLLSGEDTIICSDFQPFEIVANSFGNAVSFEWSRDPEFNVIFDIDSVTSVTDVDEALNYFFVRATNANGCPMIDTTLVTISDFDITLTPDTAVCHLDSFIIRASTQNPLNTFHYFWKNESFADKPEPPYLTDTTASFIKLSLDTDSTFYLFASSIKVPGCNASNSVRVNVSELTQEMVSATAASDSFLITSLVDLNGEPGLPFIFEWSGPYLTSTNTQATTARPKEDSEYVYTVIDPNNEACTFSDQVNVFSFDIVCDEPEIFVPDAFTPNGDGANDEFIVRGPNIDEIDLRIYDRWGNEVFASQDKNQGWNGIYKDELLQPAVFNYYLEARCINGRQFFKKGNLSLLAP